FLTKTKEVSRNFEFKLNQLKRSNWSFLFDRFEPTRPDSHWVRRFRNSNMMRHHYVIHPLLTYTEASKKGMLKDLTKIGIDFKAYRLDEGLLKESPRRVKFWECCMSVAFESISAQGRKKEIEIDNKVETDIFGISHNKKSKSDNFYLDDAFIRYKVINQNHIPSYELDEKNFKEHFYKRKNTTKRNSPIVNTQEIIVGSDQRSSKK